jgi:hypothetical protein
MWAILKIDKKKLFLLKNDLEKILNSKVKFYIPKIKIEKVSKKKARKEFKYELLGDYVFCFSEKFKIKNNIYLTNYTRGLKYFLNGFENSQNDIEKFIKICTEAENNTGFLTQKIFELKLNKYYKFLNGPFASKIFQLVEMQKNKIGFKFGKLKSYICKKDILFTPV